MRSQMNRTTVYLPVDLVNAAKQTALLRRTSLTKLVERGLQTELGLAPQSKRLNLGSHKLGRYQFNRSDAYK